MIYCKLYYYILQEKKKKRNVSHHTVSKMKFKEFLKWYVSKRPPLQVDFLMDENDWILVDYIKVRESA